MKKKNNVNSDDTKRVLLLVTIIMLGIAFAGVTTTLIINGKVNIEVDSENFKRNVVFSSVGITNSEIEGVSAQITSNGKKINFTTHSLKRIGDTSKITYKIKNESQYKAKIGQLNCNPIGSNSSIASSYVSVQPSNNLKDHVLPARTGVSDDDFIEISLIRSYINDASSESDLAFSYECVLDAEALEN